MVIDVRFVELILLKFFFLLIDRLQVVKATYNEVKFNLAQFEYE